MKTVRALCLLLAMLIVASCHSPLEDALGETPDSASACYERALNAYDSDSIRLAEQLLNQAIRLAKKGHIVSESPDPVSPQLYLDL